MVHIRMYGTSLQESANLWFTYRCTVPTSHTVVHIQMYGTNQHGLPTCGSHTDVRYQLTGNMKRVCQRVVHIQMYGTNQRWPANLWFTYIRMVTASGDLSTWFTCIRTVPTDWEQPTCGSHTDVRYQLVKICQLGSYTYVRYQLTMNMKRVCQLVVHIPKYGTNLHQLAKICQLGSHTDVGYQLTWSVKRV